MATRVLVIDNYDSFVYNLVQYLGELGAEPIVHRNDALTVDEAMAIEARRRPHLARAGPSGGRRHLVRADRGGRRRRARRCSACASATRRSATSSAPASAGPPS